MDLYEKYHLTRIINACGKMTHLAGAAVLPPIAAQASASLPCFFDLGELEERAGALIAEATGAEWGCISACTSAGITLSVAACITGSDRGKIAQLPDTSGMANEVVIQRGHSVNFGAPITQMIRLSGASTIEIGTVNDTAEYHLEMPCANKQPPSSASSRTIPLATVRFPSNASSKSPMPEEYQ